MKPCFRIVLLALAASSSVALAAPPGFEALEKQYGSEVRPLLKKFCLDCHSTKELEGDLDLERFAGLKEVRREPRVWQKVVEMLDYGEMPPRDKPQPAAAERKRLRDWVQSYLEAEAHAGAGDPGPVVLRRLSNVEYNNTVRDLTGVDLQPAREFPVDGAAGEGFTNVGDALVMSPGMLDKYLAAAKGIAAHAVLLPDGFRFSETATRRDWTDEIVGRIRQVYRRHTDPQGSTRVNLQGLQWDTNAGGRIPLEPYLTTLIANRDALAAGTLTWPQAASEKGLSPKYLQLVWTVLNGREPSPLLDPLRIRFQKGTAADVPALGESIRQWQGALTKFGSVAHFKPWLQPVNPLVEGQAFRLKLPTGNHDVVVSLVASDAGDGAAGDVLEWQQPRLLASGRPDILLKDLCDGWPALLEKRKSLVQAAKYIAAVDEIRSQKLELPAVAKERQLDPQVLAAWAAYLGQGGGELKLESLFTGKIEESGTYKFVKGWGTHLMPLVISNASGDEVRVPGILKPHSVAVHPSPTHWVVVGWRSPVEGKFRIEPRVAHAHPECGNGLAWSLELRRGTDRRALSGGEIDRATAAKIEPVDGLAVRIGDLIALRIGPRAGDHTCDLTEVDLSFVEQAEPKRTWNLAKDVSGDILAGNPHADMQGNADVWHFYPERIAAASTTAGIPIGSLLDQWRDASSKAERDVLAQKVQDLLAGPRPKDGPDALLHDQVLSLTGPLLGQLDFRRLAAQHRATGAAASEYGLPAGRFGSHPEGKPVDDASLMMKAPAAVEIRIPAELAAGREFVTTALLDRHSGTEGSVQPQVILGPAPKSVELVPTAPIVVRNGSPSKARLEQAFDEFRKVLPAAVCYPQIVPVDEVVTLVLFHREDEALSRLFLDDAEAKELERLWDELRYVSQDALKVQEAYGQFMEYVTQDGDPKLFEPLRQPIAERAAAFRKRLEDTAPKHVESLVEFAGRAWRRPLTDAETAQLRNLYGKLRKQDLDHEAAFRLTLARVLAAPSFLYKGETSQPGTQPQPVNPWELASRLSYFLWSSTPDAELRALAAEGRLADPQVMAAQMRRMLKDPRARSLATEFACQWIDVRGFDAHNEKSDQVFPEFGGLRGAMYEESVRFFADLFQGDGSVLEILSADATFLNEPLAKLYGIPGVAGPEWRKVEGVGGHGRGGILGMASVLARHSGASRTSPVLRGNWLVEMLLGEKLPKPPKGVPQLPESELATEGLTVRQITEKHRSVESCAKCHERIDPFGFALEGFDAIGRRRDRDLAGRAIDTRVRLRDGTEFAGIEGLRTYLLTKRRDEFLRQFCRKLLGYALGRSVQLSDEPLLAAMKQRLTDDGFHVQTAVLAILESPQFRTRRGVDAE